MTLCCYGCGNEALYKLRNEKDCCSKSYCSCPVVKGKNIKSNIGKHGHWTGKKFSIEVREKIRDAKLGERNHMYGKTRTSEIKASISQKNKGRLIGNKNPNWRGGISLEPYCDVWLDKDYKESIKERDGYKCTNCGCVHKRLDAHHLYSFTQYPECLIATGAALLGLGTLTLCECAC